MKNLEMNILMAVISWKKYYIKSKQTQFDFKGMENKLKILLIQNFTIAVWN